MSIVSLEDHFGCAIADITTGDCFLTEVDKPQKLLDEINKFVPAEIICNDAFFMSGVDTEDLKDRLRICIFPLDNWYFDDSPVSYTHLDELRNKGVRVNGVGYCNKLLAEILEEDLMESGNRELEEQAA